MDRRQLLRASAGLGLAAPGLLALGACATAGAEPAPRLADSPRRDYRPDLGPIRARTDRIFDVTVCLRPFRAAGPRLEVEQVGPARVVHNYGHGGSGWSLSWGSAALAVRRVMETSPREVAVVGFGAIGITSAILLQEAGCRVTIYARDMLPQARSARATGSWTPDSRIALESGAAPDFGARWEEMARFSFKRYRQYLGLPGDPVEWSDRYFLSDGETRAEPAGAAVPEDPARVPHDWAEYVDRIRDLTPRSELLPPGATPFPTRVVRRRSDMQFNIADYAHTLMTDFFAAGGRFERREFASLAELGALPEKVVVNCPGYGARALCRDESIVPVRGQIAWLIPSRRCATASPTRAFWCSPAATGSWCRTSRAATRRATATTARSPTAPTPSTPCARWPASTRGRGRRGGDLLSPTSWGSTAGGREGAPGAAGRATVAASSSALARGPSVGFAATSPPLRGREDD